MPRNSGNGNKKPKMIFVHYRTTEDKVKAIEEISKLEGHKSISETRRMIESLGIFYYTMKQAGIDLD